MSSRCRYEVATRVYENGGLMKSRKQISAHVVRDDFVLQPKHVQGGDLEGNVVEHPVLLARAAETGHNNGEAEAEVGLESTLLEGAEHGHERGSLAEAQDAVEGTLAFHRVSHSCHALIDAQASLTLLQGVETPGLDVRKPPSPGGCISFSLLRSF